MSFSKAAFREWVAIGICALTVMLAYYFFSLSLPSAPVLFALALTWICLGGWLSGQWKWVRGKSWQQLRAGFVAGEMPRLTATARVIATGGLAFGFAYLSSLVTSAR